MKPFHLLLVIAALLPTAAKAEFALRDNDTVVFLGDSITASRQYGKVIENYTLLRFPERKIRFINAGRGGETAKGSLTRLQQDVFDQGATVVTVAYGVNDIGWGTKADEAHKREYLDSIGELIERCHQRGVRVFICSAAVIAEDPEKGEKGFLQKMCDEGLALAKEKGAGAIDVQRTMRSIQRRALAHAKDPAKDKPLHVNDGIHLNELGQLAMAFAILKGLDAPAEVSAATIDAGEGTAVAAEGCTITGIERGDDSLSFIRSDKALPLNLHPLWVLQQAFIPIGDELNRFLLSVRNLPEGRYEISAGNRPLGSWNAGDLARGINIASSTADGWVPGGPWDAQAHTLKILTDMRDELVAARRGMEQTMASHPRFATLVADSAAVEEKITALQRDVARPIPAKFIVRKAAPREKQAQEKP
ncbi:MAG: GDSL-type esterase/lipase family protein [Verrucomicrobiota bacterium]